MTYEGCIDGSTEDTNQPNECPDETRYFDWHFFDIDFFSSDYFTLCKPSE